MSINIRIWVEISHQPAYRAGGWAYVSAEGSARLGAAGGERSLAPERIALLGLTEALGATPAGAQVELRSASPAVLAAVRRLTPGNEPPTEDLDLWAKLAASITARSLKLLPATQQPKTPQAFALAWADLARDKAKTKPFRATIPKINLEKAFVPT